MTAVILIGVAVITACAVNLKPTKAAEEPTATPTILGGAPAEYTGVAQKIVTDLPAGMRYAISTEYIDPATIDAGKIVPAGYTALDYLQGTGTQWIDTGFSTDTGMVARYAAVWSKDNSGSDCVVGAAGNGNNYGLLRPDYSTEDSCRWELGFANRTIIERMYGNGVDKKYTVQFSTVSENVYLDVDNNRVITDTDVVTYNASTNINLFTSRFDDSVGSACSAWLYYAIIWSSDGELVRDFVPVRRDDGKLGMYDVYNNKFYENNGTGEFIAGEAVNTAAKNLVWADNVNDPNNQKVLAANTKYYVYYYTPNSDTTTVSAMSVKEIDVQCNTHVYGEWQTKTAAGCTTDGVRQRVCQGCEHVDSEVIPAIGHTYTQSFDQTTGNTTFTCIRCDHSYSYACTDKENGHSFIDDTPTPAECEAMGYTTHRCTTCQYSYRDTYIPALGHKYGAWTTIEPATTDAAGVQKRICDQCGAEQTRSIAPLAGTTTNGGKDNSAPLLWGIIIGIIAVLAGCGGLAWLLLAVFKPKKEKNTEPPKTPKPQKGKHKEPKVATA